MEWSLDGFAGTVFMAEWTRSVLRFPRKTRGSSFSQHHCATKSTSAVPRAVHSLCSWASSIYNQHWMERKALHMGRNSPRKIPMVLIDFAGQFKSIPSQSPSQSSGFPSGHSLHIAPPVVKDQVALKNVIGVLKIKVVPYLSFMCF